MPFRFSIKVKVVPEVCYWWKPHRDRDGPEVSSMHMLSCPQQLCIYIYTEEKDREDKRRAERSGHLIRNLSLLMAGCSPQPSQFTKTAVIFISRVSPHLANDDLLFASSAAEAFVKVQTLKTLNRSINILQPKLGLFFGGRGV